MNRDNYTRCKHCGLLWEDKQCIMDDVNGLQCPNGCKEQFIQPDYQSPLNQDYNDSEMSYKKM